MVEETRIALRTAFIGITIIISLHMCDILLRTGCEFNRVKECIIGILIVALVEGWLVWLVLN